MAALERRAACGFGIDEAMTVEELSSLGEGERAERLIPLSTLFSSLSEVILPEFYERLFRSGCEIYEKKIGISYEADTLVRVSGEKSGFFSIGQVREYPDGLAVKSVKLFYL